MTEISVIVPLHNAARSLAFCLEALLQQDDPPGDCEVIAVDNNSTDASRAIAREFPAVRLLSEARQSAYAARNRGLQAATGRLIAFTDPDCVPRPDWLHRLGKAMADPKAMVVMGRDRPAGRSLTVRLLGEYDHFQEAFTTGSADPTAYSGHTNNLIARRELFDRVGGFDERMRGADVIFVHRVLALYGTEAVRYEPNAIVDHLEIDSARAYFKKAFLYGRSARRYSRDIPARPLRNAERIRVFRDTVHSGRLSAAEAGLLFGLLAVGVACHQLGRLSVRSASATRLAFSSPASHLSAMHSVSSGAPELAVVLVTANRFASLRRTIRHLKQQTARDRIELLLVGPDEASFADLDPESLVGFAGWRVLAAGPIREVERALAVGVAAARAPIVALLENHVYPEPGWASAILGAHHGPWAAVGSVIRNANPATAASWVEHFLSYGFDDESATGGEVRRVPRNNTTFKRDVLRAFGDRLPDVLARDGGLLEELQRRRCRFYLEPQARMEHLNPSRLGPILTLRVLSARASAATRARSEQWSRGRRLLYVAASPVFPALRLRALWPRLRLHPERHILPRIAPLLALALVVDAFGQALGFAFGAGGSPERAGRYDLDRLPYVCASERTRFAE